VLNLNRHENLKDHLKLLKGFSSIGRAKHVLRYSRKATEATEISSSKAFEKSLGNFSHNSSPLDQKSFQNRTVNPLTIMH
jgi:hypothetical protein